MDLHLHKMARASVSKGYGVSSFQTAQEAEAYRNRQVDGKTVGFGDSETHKSMRP